MSAFNCPRPNADLPEQQFFGFEEGRILILHVCSGTVGLLVILFQSLTIKRHFSSSNWIQVIMISRVQLRRSVLVLAFFAIHYTGAFTSPSDVSGPLSPDITSQADRLRQQWIDKSVDYYSKVMREERRKNMGQISDDVFESVQYQDDFRVLAKKHYFALRKIKDGKHKHAELIYRRIIDEIMNEEEDGHCDHAKLAVTTLLLALHCQRMGDLKKARAVFIQFFRVVVVNGEEDLSECACSAKVLGAYALFEMKQGHKKKSLEIAQKAVEFDQALQPLLNWKQFRVAKQG
jgi:hypothetical protein